MKEKQMIENINAAANEEERLLTTLLDGYDHWAQRRQAVRHYSAAVGVALLLSMVSTTAAAQQLPHDKMATGHVIDRPAMVAIGNQIVQAL